MNEPAMISSISTYPRGKKLRNIGNSYTWKYQATLIFCRFSLFKTENTDVSRLFIRLYVRRFVNVVLLDDCQPTGEHNTRLTFFFFLDSMLSAIVAFHPLGNDSLTNLARLISRNYIKYIYFRCRNKCHCRRLFG